MTAIAALTPSRVIGKNGSLPWHLPADLKFFKATTLGHVVLMGRKTFDSIGKPLPGRENWVLTRGPHIAGTHCFSSLEGLPKKQTEQKIFVIGGASVYRLLLPYCQEAIMTLVHAEYEGDTWFPPFEEDYVHAETLLETADFTIRRFQRK